MKQFTSADVSHIGENPLGPPDVREEISALKESLNQTRTELTRLRRRIDRQQMASDAQARRANVLWVVTVLVAVGISAAIWYGIRNKDIFVPPSAAAPTSAVPEKRSSIESDYRSEHLRGSHATPDIPVVSSVEQHSAKVTTLSEKPASKLAAPDTIRGNEEVGTDRSISRKTASAEAQLTPQRSDDIATTDAVNRTRIDFELSSNKTEEVAPGIYLTVRNTNVDRQQIDGWLQIAEEGRTIWLRSQGARKSMAFTSKRDERSRQLVITRIDKQRVAGYLLIPVPAA